MMAVMQAIEGFGMSANQSYGGMASTRDEEEVHTYEGFGVGVIASTRAEEEVLSDEGLQWVQTRVTVVWPHQGSHEEEVPSNEAMSENQSNCGMASTTGDEERSERRNQRKGSSNMMIALWLFILLVVSLLSVASSIGFALEIMKLKSETASIQQELEALRGNL
jgi:hypothetical protein